MMARVGGALALGAAVLIAVALATNAWWAGHPHIKGHEIELQTASLGLRGGELCNTGGDGHCRDLPIKGAFFATGIATTVVGGLAILGLLAAALGGFRGAAKRAGIAKVALVGSVLAVVPAIAFIVSRPSSADVPVGYGMMMFWTGIATAVAGCSTIMSKPRPPRPARAPRPARPARVPVPTPVPVAAVSAPAPELDVAALFDDKTAQSRAPRPPTFGADLPPAQAFNAAAPYSADSFLPPVPPPLQLPPTPYPRGLSSLPGLGSSEFRGEYPGSFPGSHEVGETTDMTTVPVEPASTSQLSPLPAPPPVADVAPPPTPTPRAPSPPPAPPAQDAPRAFSPAPTADGRAPAVATAIPLPPLVAPPVPPRLKPPTLAPGVVVPPPRSAAAALSALLPPPHPRREQERASTMVDAADVPFGGDTSPGLLAPEPAPPMRPSDPDDAAMTHALERMSASAIDAVMSSAPRHDAMPRDSVPGIPADDGNTAPTPTQPPPEDSAPITEPARIVVPPATIAISVAPPPTPPPIPPMRSSAPSIPPPIPKTPPASSQPIPVVLSTAPDSLAPPSADQIAATGPSPACPQCSSPMAWVDEHLRFYCPSCRMYF